MSNQTKLLARDKEMLRELREIQGKGFNVFHFPERRVTVGVRYIIGHNAARVFVSLASPEETKFRKKVGEYIVRNMFDAWIVGNSFAGVPYSVAYGETPVDIAGRLAAALGHYG